jgi:hypothetical protein
MTPPLGVIYCRELTPVGILTMTTIEIDTEKDHENVRQQIRELKTHELLRMYDMFGENEIATTILDEMSYRKENYCSRQERQEIEERLGD